MSLHEQWMKTAYTPDRSQINGEVWDDYVPREQKIYEHILKNRLSVFTCSPKSLSKEFNLSVIYAIGFLDGINDTLNEPVDLKNIEEDTEVTLKIDFSVLYKKMVEYKAEHLCNLPEWSNIYTDEELKALYKEQKTSRTFKRETIKTGRNDPCPCGSGKKYKKCCQSKEN